MRAVTIHLLIHTTLVLLLVLLCSQGRVSVSFSVSLSHSSDDSLDPEVDYDPVSLSNASGHVSPLLPGSSQCNIFVMLACMKYSHTEPV